MARTIVRVKIVPEFSWLDALKMRLAGARAMEAIIRRECEGVRLVRLTSEHEHES